MIERVGPSSPSAHNIQDAGTLKCEIKTKTFDKKLGSLESHSRNFGWDAMHRVSLMPTHTDPISRDIRLGRILSHHPSYPTSSLRHELWPVNHVPRPVWCPVSPVSPCRPRLSPCHPASPRLSTGRHPGARSLQPTCFLSTLTWREMRLAWAVKQSH